MDEEMMFSLSYEQMTQMAEGNKAMRFSQDGTHYVQVNKAHDILRFWYLGAARTHGPATTRVEADYKRLKTLISQRNNNDAGKIPTSVAAAAAGADCAGRPRCETSGAGGDAGYRAGAGAGRGRPGVRTEPARLLPAHGSRGLAAHPARPNLQLAVELTEAGRGIAEPLFQAEREAETARQRLTDVRRLPLRQTAAGDAVELQLDDGHYTIREAAYVIRLDGTTCS
jgi:hypothetical protein